MAIETNEKASWDTPPLEIQQKIIGEYIDCSIKAVTGSGRSSGSIRKLANISYTFGRDAVMHPLKTK